MKAARVLNLTAFTARDPDKIDMSRVRWDPKLLASILSSLWQTRGRLAMRYDVYTHRMLGALRVKLDREGYTLRMQTELSRGTVVVWIGQKYRGNRPRRGTNAR